MDSWHANVRRYDSRWSVQYLPNWGKVIDAAAIDDGRCFGDRSPIVGFPEDGGAVNSMVRFALRVPERDRVGNCRVCHDFGSAHVAGWNVAMCDASVRIQAFDIDLIVHRQQASSRGSD